MNHSSPSSDSSSRTIRPGSDGSSPLCGGEEIRTKGQYLASVHAPQGYPHTPPHTGEPLSQSFHVAAQELPFVRIASSHPRLRPVSSRLTPFGDDARRPSGKPAAASSSRPRQGTHAHTIGC